MRRRRHRSHRDDVRGRRRRCVPHRRLDRPRRSVRGERERGSEVAPEARRLRDDRSKVMKRALLVLLVVLVALAAAAAFFINSQRNHQLVAMAALERGDISAATPHLRALRQRTVWFPAVTKEDAAKRLFARGSYAEFLAYDESFIERNQSASVMLDRAAALALGGRADAASKIFSAVNAAKVDPKQYASVRAAIDARINGRIPYVFDRA